MGKVVGIDLGTTFSVVAYIDNNGNPKVLHNREGDVTTPSAVLFLDDEVLVGKEAKRNGVSNPQNYVSEIKRNIGNRNFVFRNELNEEYSSEAITAIILKKIKEDAELALGDTIEGAVITVPAYFYDEDRTATKNAAKIAGINVLGIINEPTAAAIAYGLEKSNNKSTNIMVYDLGGGTFDVSIVNITDTKINILGSDGTRVLGGCDFDKKIIEYVLAEASKKGIDITNDKIAMQSLCLAAEEAKKSLSASSKARITVNCNGIPLMVTITKEQFEQMIDPLLYDTTVFMNSAMEEANLDYSELDKILLVGGSTRIPAVTEYIKTESDGIIPSSDIHPDEAVAIGAAYYAVNICKNSESKPEKEDIYLPNSEKKDIPNVNNRLQEPSIKNDIDLPSSLKSYDFVERTSHGIGVVIEEKGVEKNKVVLPKNSIVPASSTMMFTTLGNYQEIIVLEVTEGQDDDVRFVKIIGSTELKVKPKKHKVDIEISISYDKDSCIHIRVRDVEDNEDLGEMEIIHKNNLSDGEIRNEQTRIGKLNIGD